MRGPDEHRLTELPLQTRLGIFRLMLLFDAFACVALSFVHPLIGLSAFLLSILVFVIYTARKPQLWQACCDTWRRRLKRLKGAFGGNYVSQTREFTPDHMLRGTHAAMDGVLIDKEEFIVGRDESCDLVIDADASISRRHCRIIYRSYTRQYMLEDLRSKYGTYLGARRLEPNTQVLLMDNAEISLNQLKFTFCRKEAAPARDEAQGVYTPSG